MHEISIFMVFDVPSKFTPLKRFFSMQEVTSASGAGLAAARVILDGGMSVQNHSLYSIGWV